MYLMIGDHSYKMTLLLGTSQNDVTARYITHSSRYFFYCNSLSITSLIQRSSEFNLTDLVKFITPSKLKMLSLLTSWRSRTLAKTSEILPIFLAEKAHHTKCKHIYSGLTFRVDNIKVSWCLCFANGFYKSYCNSRRMYHHFCLW